MVVNRSQIAITGQIPSNQQLITSVQPLKVLDAQSVISEAAGGRSVLRITGIFQIADEPNQNGRVYPRNVLSEAVQLIQEDIGSRKVMGELDHPSDAKIHLDRVSHLLTKLWMEGKNVYGVAEVLEDMPCGKILSTLIRNKVQIGISSRGVGDMETISEGREQYQRVLPGYSFVTWDIVGEPSVKTAVMHVMESRNRLAAANRLVTRATRTPQAALMSELSSWLQGKGPIKL
jgi:hypothetical protein